MSYNYALDMGSGGKGFFSIVGAQWGAAGIIAAILAAGAALAAYYKLPTTVAAHGERLGHVEWKVREQEIQQQHIHEEVTGVRQDIRDLRSGAALPVLTPHPLPTMTPEAH